MDKKILISLKLEIKKLIIANWKSNKTALEAVYWLEELNKNRGKINFETKEVVVAAPYTALSSCAAYIKDNNIPIKLAAQNISEFGIGAYTGEINGVQIREFADYVLIGHSERKRYLHETDEQVEKKITQAKEAGLSVILCVQDDNSFIDSRAEYIAYEPPNAISTFGVGKAEDPQNVENVFATLCEKTNARLLYGGSVDSKNIDKYFVISGISGFLVGGASLKAESFLQLLS